MARPSLELATASPLGPALVRWLVARGVDADRVLAGTGFSRADSEADEVPSTCTGLADALDAAALAVASPHLGFRLPGELPFRRYDPASLVARTAPSARAALEAVEKFAPLVFPSLQAELKVVDDGLHREVVFSGAIDGHPRGLGYRVESYVLGLLLSFVRRAGFGITPRRARFVCARRGDITPIIQAIGTTELAFGSETFGFSVSLEEAEQPFPNADPLLCATAIRLASGALLEVPIPSNLANAVESRISAALPLVHEAREIGRMLGLSERTLQRRLELEGVSYSALVDRVREREARRRVCAPEDSLTSVAFALGFRDLPAFSRAFKRWTGMPPGMFRRRVLRPTLPPIRPTLPPTR